MARKGYWLGKTRDAHTLQRLSESKFKRVCQYDRYGNLKCIWDSKKEVGEYYFGDYEVKNGSACSKIYQLTKAINVDGRFCGISYWFDEADLINSNGDVPTKLDIDDIRATQDAQRALRRIAVNKNRKPVVPKYKTRYTVIQVLGDGSEVTYKNVWDCATQLGLSVSGVKNAISCATKRNLRYGEKQRQEL